MSVRSSVAPVSVRRYDSENTTPDLLAVEEPLQILIEHMDRTTELMVTMRTPGHDFELAVGFLFTEGIIRTFDDIQSIHYCENVHEESVGNVVRVRLETYVHFDPDRNRRNFDAHSSCGLCGKSSIDQLIVDCEIIPDGPQFHAPDILAAVGKLNKHQDVFARTGGLHACAVAGRNGKVTLVREDIGRHNALDKIIGALLVKGEIPCHENILLLSGRSSFEMIQKAARAGFPLVAAIGAPSNLAVSLASSLNITLLGFVRDGNFNIYTAQKRLRR